MKHFLVSLAPVAFFSTFGAALAYALVLVWNGIVRPGLQIGNDGTLWVVAVLVVIANALVVKFAYEEGQVAGPDKR